jgi:hypothetical protein
MPTSGPGALLPQTNAPRGVAAAIRQFPYELADPDGDQR